MRSPRGDYKITATDCGRYKEMTLCNKNYKATLSKRNCSK